MKIQSIIALTMNHHYTRNKSAFFSLTINASVVTPRCTNDTLPRYRGDLCDEGINYCFIFLIELLTLGSNFQMDLAMFLAMYQS